jgi:hypothetical protein
VGILHPTASQKNDTTLLDQKVPTLGQHDYCNDKTNTSPDGNKLNIYTKKEKKKQKKKKQNEEKIIEKEDCEATSVRSVDSLWESHQQYVGSKVQDKYNANIGIVHLQCCTNRGGTRRLPSSLGQLLRIGSLESLTWTKKNSTKPCNYVFPDNQSNRYEKDDNASVYQVSKADACNEPQEDIKDPLILVEKISNGNDRLRVANSVGISILNKYPIEEYIDSIQQIKRYGFNHIIVIGECIYGIFFYRLLQSLVSLGLYE